MLIIFESAHDLNARSLRLVRLQVQDSLASDSTKLDSLKNQPYEPTTRPRFKMEDRFGDPFSNRPSRSPLTLKDPASMTVDVEIDTGMNYTIYEKIGGINYRPLSTMSFSEFDNYQDKLMKRTYWKDKSAGLDAESAVSGRSLLPKLFISPVLDRIFGGSYVDIQPNGFLNLDFGGRWQKIENPAIPIRQQRTGGFNYNQQISMNVTGKIGDKLAVTANFDNNNSFDFQNNLKLEYTGYDEDIIKKIEVGNISMPISNSLMTGGQSLFGLKTQLQFGKLFVTAVASRQQGRNEVLNIPSGFQGKEFEVRASDYDENKHFFLGHFFRDNYERWLSRLPQVISGVNVTRVEVYLLNRNNETQTLRNIVGVMDLGEGSRVFNQNVQGRVPGPNDNAANDLYEDLIDVPDIRNIESAADYLTNNYSMTKTKDFETITASRKLDPREYTWNKQLGYVSLLRRLQNDEVLAVSYEYTYNGRRYQVGELSEDYQGRQDDDLILLKLLRPTKIDTKIPTWDLMMKNVYYLNAYRLSEEGFTLRVNYRDDITNIDNPSLNEGAQTKDIPLVRLLGLDELNRNGDRQRDGNFDFINDVTVDMENGNIMFPVLEPFGKTLKSHFQANEQTLINRYVFDTLYRTTRIAAQQVASKNKFFILGSFQSGSASEIRLEGINIPEESVRVSAGGTQLTQGLHYTVDGRLGVVRIIDEGILSSGKDLQISYEKADLFNFQTRWLTGAHFDYRFSDDFNLGATIMHLNERPGGITRFKVGDEPTRNTKYGFDLNYQKESRFLTKMIDALPILNTKEKSNFSFNGEFAQILPGTSNIVNGDGTSYIDDFENAAIPINIAGGHIPWKLSSTPETVNNKFITDNGLNNLGHGYKRAKLAWYIVDNTFYRGSGGNRPDNISDEDLANNYVKPILPQDIFKQQDRQIINVNLPIFDLAYYPSERGPYNYNPNLTPEGLLNNPEQNFGGITRANTNEVNWNQNNVEYLEFWMMDPFVLGPQGQVLDGLFNQNNSTGGELIFNFGSISEDLMKDNRHAFENGLPSDGSFENTTTTEWGKVTTLQYLTDFFDNSSDETRLNQDVGFDGLKSTEEIEFGAFQDFVNQPGLNQTGRERVGSDVSADDFKYFLDQEFDDNNVKILERYKQFNGTENNSSPSTGAAFTPQSTNIPENEDINNDNTISDTEEYFEYKVPMRPGQLEVGQNNIIDQVQDAQGVNWFLFRIPVRNPDNIVGEPTFESIKFYRMYMTGWRQPVVLRFAKLQLVGSQWRKFEENLEQSGFSEIPETTTSDFDVSVVNIEENSIASEGKSPYVVPPGLSRDLDNTTTIQRRNNEQSLRICVEGLEDGDARAVFKNVGLDLLNYGRLKMFFHAENNGDVFLEDDEVTAFIRFGRDFVENYYEIEVPLKVTPSGLTGGEVGLDRLVWPEENEIDISIDELYALKLTRDREGFNQQQTYSALSENGKYNLSVEGNPKMSSVQTLMIGVRNTKSDDLQDKSICIWANELRVADFDKQAGWAANARTRIQLADFARINGSAKYTTVGFGSIQERISERTREETIQYDISADINLDKLIPGKHGIKIPMYVSSEKTIATPKFDPLDQDLPLQSAILSFGSLEEQEDYKRKVQDRTTRKAINFSNVRKDKVNPEAKSHIYDIENFSFNYAYSESLTSGVNTAEFREQNYRGGFAYNFNPSPKPIEPFKNVGFLDGKYLALIKDFNFSLLPNNLSMRAEVDRRFTKRQLRNSDLTTNGIDPYFEKYFNINRSYGLRWNLTKSLSVDYNASARAIVDEPQGDLDTQEKRDSVMYNLQHFGRMKNFDQNMGANYRLPLDKIPLTDWISADLRFAVGYNWNGGSFDQIQEFGNIISNNRDQSATSKIDMVKLYNKVGFLKEINTPKRKSTSRRSQPTVKEDTTKTKTNFGFFKGILRAVMSLRSINLTYSVREATSLPGFTPRAYLFGLDSGLNAPGRAFIFGSQDPNIRFKAAENGWLVTNPFLTSSFTQMQSEDLGLKAMIEPFSDLKIQVDMKRTNSGDFQEIFRYDSISSQYNSLTPTRSGTYSVSFLSIKTAFQKDNAENISPNFSDFETYRSVIQSRLNALNSTGEYGINSQDVLIPAFIAAYSGKDPNTSSLTPFPKIPLPNWRVDYAGLKNLPVLKDLVSSINITHSYSSVFRINNYTNSLLYDNALDLSNSITNYPEPSISNDNGLIPVYILNEVNIAERFSPLIGVNVRTKSRSTVKVEWKKERNLSLNLSNSQITEIQRNDISFDYGVTKKGWKFPFKIQGKTVTVKNDMDFRITFTIRDDKTVQRKIDDVTTVTAGNVNYQVRPTVSYVANEKLRLTMYFERNINQPRVSNSFPRATTAFGIQMRFSLAQ